MTAGRVAIASLISLAILGVICVPLSSLAEESRAESVREALGKAALSVFDVDADGFAETLDNNGDGRSDLPDLVRSKAGRMVFEVDDEKGRLVSARHLGQGEGDKRRATSKVAAHLVLSLTYKESGVSADQDVTEEEKKAPMPSDAILGVKKLKRAHVDLATERLVASVGEQARYIGRQEEVPASILIAEAILEDGRSTSELATSASYAVYGEYLEEVAEQYVEWLGRTDDSYDEVLESLESAGVLETDYADSLRDLIETYELDRYDKPLRNSLDGTLVDAATGEDLGLSYTDYANLERIATSYIGTPYVWGGSTEDTGFDCSGLVQWSYSKALGLLIPRTTYYQQYVGVSVPLDVDKLRMGDLLFFHDNSEGTYHVAMYLADGYYLHAPHSGDVVRIASMEDFAPTFARRLVEFAPAE